MNAIPFDKLLALGLAFGSLLLVEVAAPDYATLYVIVLILGVMVYNAAGLGAFAAELQKDLKT